MKRYIRNLFIPALVLLLIFIYAAAFADSPTPPPLPGEHGGGGNVQAPIDGGLSILLALGLGYAGRKFFRGRRKDVSEDSE